MAKNISYLAATVAFVFFIVLWLNLTSSFVQYIDTSAVNLFEGNRFIGFFHYFGEPWFVIVIAVILVGLLAYYKHPRLIVFVLLTFAGGTILNQLLKKIIERPRPERLEQLTSFSFPSGHSMSGLLYLFATAYIVTRFIKSEKLAWLSWVAALVFTILIGLARIAETRHFGSDVLAGWSMGFVWLMMCVYWYELKDKRA